MYIHFIGKGETVLPTGWGDEAVISVLAPTRIDATAASEEGAKLTVVTFLCGAKVVVPPGAQVQLSGGDVLGSHSIDVEPAAGGLPARIQAIPILGEIKIESA